MIKVKRIKYLIGTLLFYLSFFMLIPLIWSILERGPDIAAFVATSLITLSAGLFLMRTGKAPSELTLRECFLFVTLAWILAAMLSALPFYLSGAIPGYPDAFFEAMSGLTTTGASVLTEVESLPAGLLFWRSMTHWLGGMGIIVLFVAVFPRLGVSATHLLQAESPGPITQRLAPRIAQTAKILWVLYITITVLQTVILMAAGLPLFDALVNTFGTVATGGFSTRNYSIASYASSTVEWIIIFFMFIAGGNFALYYKVFIGKFRHIWRDVEFRFYFLVVLVATLLVFFNLSGFMPGAGGRFRASLFQVVSIVTTTGYSTVDFNQWPVFSQAILLLLMFFGGCGGSTAGAIKQIRILVVLKYLVREIKKSVHPHAVIPLRVGGVVLPDTSVNSIVAFFCLYLLIFCFGVFVLSFLGYDLVTAISAVAATQGNIGPGLGAVGPASSYGFMNNLAKIVLSFLMMIGRLEIYTVFAFLMPENGLHFNFVNLKKRFSGNK